MDTIKQIQEIAMRLDHLEQSGDWLSQLEEQDPTTAQTGALISTLADDVRKRMLDLISKLEREIYINTRTH